MFACQVADYILTLVQQGERGLDLLKASAFKKVLRRAAGAVEFK